MENSPVNLDRERVEWLLSGFFLFNNAPKVRALAAKENWLRSVTFSGACSLIVANQHHG